jgi:hypothetical protein
MLKIHCASLAALGCAFVLIGCGGGGGDAAAANAPELSGTYGLTALSEVLTTASVRAELPPGVQGTPTCSLLSGQTPPGMTFSSNCSLAGKPTEVGLYSFSLSLTVSGYRGSATVNAGYAVGGPALLRGSWSPDGNPMPLDSAIAPATAAQIGAQTLYTVQPGDVVTFGITGGALPAGLVLETATGTVRGTPTALGDFTVSIGAVLARAGGSYTMAPLRITGNVRAPFATLRYGQGTTLTLPLTQASSNAPEISPPVPGVASVRYALTSRLPAGLSLDSATGVVGGNPTNAGTSNFSVRASVTTASGARFDLDSEPLTLVLTGILPSYPFGTNGSRSITLPGEYPSFIRHTAARNVSASFAIGDVYGGQAGDAYGFELVATTQALPAWLSIDAGTGTVRTAIPPDFTGPAPSYRFDVRVTTQRGGITYVASQTWEISVTF